MELVWLWSNKGEVRQKVEQAVRKWSKGPALMITPVGPHIRDRSEGSTRGGTSSKKTVVSQVVIDPLHGKWEIGTASGNGCS